MVGAKDEHDAFEVMCGCRAFIIPNSTFSWWAAWLSGSQIVVRPERFLNKRHWEIGPDRWIRVPGEGVQEVGPRAEFIGPQQPRRRSTDSFVRCEGRADVPRLSRYRVLSYRNGGNLGDTIQTLALSRLLPGMLEGVYRDAADFLLPGPPFVVNGYLCENTPHSPDCIFAGIYVGGRRTEQLEWIRQSRYSIGARDPATVQVLRTVGIESEMIGCATLTLPRYTGARHGCVRIDDFTPDCKLTQTHNNLGAFTMRMRPEAIGLAKNCRISGDFTAACGAAVSGIWHPRHDSAECLNKDFPVRPPFTAGCPWI